MLEGSTTIGSTSTNCKSMLVWCGSVLASALLSVTTLDGPGCPPPPPLLLVGTILNFLEAAKGLVVCCVCVFPSLVELSYLCQLLTKTLLNSLIQAKHVRLTSYNV